MKILSITILLACFTLTVQSQACGSGIFTFEFYILNGEQPNNINYEVLPVNRDSIKDMLLNPYHNMYDGIVITSTVARNITDTSETTQLEKQLAIGSNKKKGQVIEGVIKFETRELAYYPCLLKLSSNKKEIYLLVNLMGGCDRTTTILWNADPTVVR